MDLAEDKLEVPEELGANLSLSAHGREGVRGRSQAPTGL